MIVAGFGACVGILCGVGSYGVDSYGVDCYDVESYRIFYRRGRGQIAPPAAISHKSLYVNLNCRLPTLHFYGKHTVNPYLVNTY